MRKSEAEIALSNIEVNGVNSLARSFYLKHLILGGLNKSKEETKIPIIRGISLKIEHGERVGFLGYNGSGKSSLLKVIAGIYPPDKGRVQVKGSLAAIIEMGLGFESELTGRQNIQLGLVYNNRVNTYSKDLEEEIIAFTELGEKIDLPIKYYSSGMLARLAFCVSAFAESDILLLDEVFATGDSNFVKKSSEYIKNKFHNTSISVMVSHTEEIIRDNCNRCILLKNGEIIADGNTNDVLKEYNKAKV